MFWDGRATGSLLGDPLAEQAQGPFLNPLEQALPSAQVLCVKVKQADYAGLFEQVWSAGCGGMGGGCGDMNCEDMASMFPPPEVDANRATLGMFPRMQVDNIVAFRQTLSDGYQE